MKRTVIKCVRINYSAAAESHKPVKCLKLKLETECRANHLKKLIFLMEFGRTELADNCVHRRLRKMKRTVYESTTGLTVCSSSILSGKLQRNFVFCRHFVTTARGTVWRRWGSSSSCLISGRLDASLLQPQARLQTSTTSTQL